MIKDIEITDVQQKIIDAARELFIRKGLKETTVRDIANASGKNIAMINYYFRSKDNLFETIFEGSFEKLITRVFAHIDSDLPLFELIDKWVCTYYDSLHDDPKLPLFVIYEFQKNPERLIRKIRLKNPYQTFGKLAIRINKEVEKGTIKEIPVSNFILSVISLSVFPIILSTVAPTLLGLIDDQYKELLDGHKKFVVDFIINAIKKE
ncbi:MAG: TetR/AcrR family transcriptional regulator [Tannerella sp.]|jgi:AcrR family transcriptional regulator|nr:TetR/AcrR family transcriptional regulator [Tannerella sp.]